MIFLALESVIGHLEVVERSLHLLLLSLFKCHLCVHVLKLVLDYLYVELFSAQSVLQLGLLALLLRFSIL